MARTPCTTCEKVCSGRGGSSTMALAPVPESCPQTHPRTPILSNFFCHRYGSRIILAYYFANGGATGDTTTSARWYSFCGFLRWWDRSASFAIFATIYMAAQNKGGDFFQTMGSVRVVSTIGYSSAPLGNMRPNLYASYGGTPIR